MDTIVYQGRINNEKKMNQANGKSLAVFAIKIIDFDDTVNGSLMLFSQ